MCLYILSLEKLSLLFSVEFDELLRSSALDVGYLVLDASHDEFDLFFVFHSGWRSACSAGFPLRYDPGPEDFKNLQGQRCNLCKLRVQLAGAEGRLAEVEDVGNHGRLDQDDLWPSWFLYNLVEDLFSLLFVLFYTAVILFHSLQPCYVCIFRNQLRVKYHIFICIYLGVYLGQFWREI